MVTALLTVAEATGAPWVACARTPAERELIGPPPVGHGLLSVVLTESQRLRLNDLTQDPRSVGFSEHHPIMQALLAVPIVSGGKVLGNQFP